MTIAGVSNYVKTHERLVLACIAAVVLYFGIVKVESIIAAHDKAVATVSDAAAQAAAKESAASAAATAAEQTKHDALEAQMQQQNAALVAANTQLAAALSAQQKKDATLPPTQLAERIETLAALPPNAIQPTQSGGFALTNPGAVQIAVTLEKTNTLAQQLTDVSTEKSNDEKLLAEDKTLASNLKSQIEGLNISITKNDKACTDDKNLLKAEARKSKAKWFGFGYVAGLATRGAIKIFTGV